MKIIRPFLLLALLISALGPASTAVRAASTITVQTLLDETSNNGFCSLREAIANANSDASIYPNCAAGSGADTIIFAGGLNGSIFLASALPVLSDTDGLTISGGASQIIINGGGVFRVFEIGAGIPAAIQNLTLAHGAGNGANIYNAGTLNLVNSTIANGVGVLGGAIYNDFGTLSVTNSTFAFNSADFGSALYNDTGIVNLTHITFFDNTITGGGAGVLYNGGALTVKNSLLAKGNGGTLCAGLPLNATSANNLADEASCGAGFGVTTIPALALGPLADHGGSTQTFSLLPASVAINAASNAFCALTDQRGAGRPQGTICDVGAFEAATSLSLDPGSLAFGNGVVGVVSAPRIVTITNTGETNLALAALSITGEFSLAADSCSWQILAPAGTCTFSVTFAPLTPLVKAGTITIPSNILASPTLIPLSGTGITGANLLRIAGFDTLAKPIPWRNPSYPYTLNAVRDCAVFFSPPCSVRFRGSPTLRVYQVYQSVYRRGVAGAMFLIRLSSKADSIPPGGIYRARIEFYSLYNQPIAFYHLDFSPGTHDWETLENIVVIPAAFGRFAFRIQLQQPSGTAWFDNAAVIPIP
ncbi:MAG: hypothetical protein HFACDABA_00557 [Anaerolineales bacterium]|nr:hypothetical protein [Anaerolineales bacterium]